TPALARGDRSAPRPRVRPLSEARSAPRHAPGAPRGGGRRHPHGRVIDEIEPLAVGLLQDLARAHLDRRPLALRTREGLLPLADVRDEPVAERDALLGL